jgi:hypothetical protein
MEGTTPIHPKHPDLSSAYKLLFNICGEMKRRQEFILMNKFKVFPLVSFKFLSQTDI